MFLKYDFIRRRALNDLSEVAFVGSQSSEAETTCRVHSTEFAEGRKGSGGGS